MNYKIKAGVEIEVEKVEVLSEGTSRSSSAWKYAAIIALCAFGLGGGDFSGVSAALAKLEFFRKILQNDGETKDDSHREKGSVRYGRAILESAAIIEDKN